MNSLSNFLKGVLITKSKRLPYLCTHRLLNYSSIYYGWALVKILYLEININKYSPMVGSSYIELPRFIALKRAVVNVRNADECCFAWAVISPLFPIENMHNQTGSYPHYSSVLNSTDGVKDPALLFFNEEIQSLLKSLTRVDYNKVFRRRKLGRDTLNDPQYKFMTDVELQEALQEANQKAEEILQIPPVIKLRKPISKVIAKDPALQGLEPSRIVFTDITYGVFDADRIIVVREPNGNLNEAECNLKQRINQVYFPVPGKSLTMPAMFQDNNLESLLDRYEYEFVLDRTCLQFEPDDPEFQKFMSITYQHLNDNNKFKLLRSTRHFGGLVFFLVWHKNIDNLLLELIETLNINEAGKLVTLYSRFHDYSFEGKTDLDLVEDFIMKSANKKGALELAIQAYKDVAREREQFAVGSKLAHDIKD